MLDDDSYSLGESQDVVRKRFIKYWEALMHGFKVCLILWVKALLTTLNY
jgi:hypothetical protein